MPSGTSTVPPPDGCKDFHQEVIATCLGPVSAVAFLPGTDADPVGLAAERTSGTIVRVQSGQTPQVVANLSVDAANGFAPEQAFLAPPVIARCVQIIATLDLDEGAVKDAFTAFVERTYQTLRAPRRPHEIWPQLSDTIFAAG